MTKKTEKGLPILNIFSWLLSGGWKYVLRTIGFDIDVLLTSLIARVYEYFMQILNGALFNEKVVSELLQNVYVFIGVIMFFRLLMLLLKYLINPDLVNDAKIGVNSLIQRVLIGLAGILFIPTLFDFALQLQNHIIQDNIIQQIIIPGDMLDAVKEKINDGGKYIGTYVLAGFISPGENASKKTKTEYNNALEIGDMSSLSTLRKDGWLVGEYEYDYFYLMSTFCLCYVLYLLVKYTLDLLTRFLRMLMYQLLAPVAMIEYMINGSDDGVFKAWKQGLLGTYFMMFIRVLALWFVVFVLVLMTTNNEYTTGSLLATDDYFLRAMIVMALLGFMMDLPKLFGQVFGLDLEQEGNANGIFKQVGGMLKGAAIGGLAIGGAAVGGAIGAGKALGSTAMNAKFGEKGVSLKDRLNNKIGQNKAMQNLGNKLSSGNMGAFMESAKEHNLSDHMQKAGKGVFAAAMGSNQFTGAAYKNYSGQMDEQTGIDKSAKAKELEAQRHKEITDNQKDQTKLLDDQLKGQKIQAAVELAAILDQSGIKVDAPTMAAKLYPEMMSNSNSSIETSAKVGGIIGATAATLSASDIDSSGHVSNVEAKQKMVQEVEQVLTAQCASSGVSVDQRAIHQQAEVIVDTSNFSVNGGTVTATVTADVSGGMEKLAAQDQTITQTVNQVQGIRMNGAIEDATQTVNQTLNRIATNTEEMNVYAEITTEHVEQMRQDLSQTVNIQRNINDSLTQSVDIQRDIRTNTEETAVWTELTAETNERTANTLSNLDNGSNIPRRSDREIPNDSRRRDE